MRTSWSHCQLLWQLEVSQLHFKTSPSLFESHVQLFTNCETRATFCQTRLVLVSRTASIKISLLRRWRRACDYYYLFPSYLHNPHAPASPPCGRAPTSKQPLCAALNFLVFVLFCCVYPPSRIWEVGLWRCRASEATARRADRNAICHSHFIDYGAVTVTQSGEIKTICSRFICSPLSPSIRLQKQKSSFCVGWIICRAHQWPSARLQLQQLCFVGLFWQGAFYITAPLLWMHKADKSSPTQN